MSVAHQVHRPAGVSSFQPGAGLVVVLGSAIVGLIVALDPGLAIMLACVPIGFVATRSTWFRVAFIVGGGILVLQSSTGVSSLKLAYVAGVIGAIGISTVRVVSDTHLASVRPVRNVLVAVLGLSLALMISTAIGVSNGVDVLDAVRDAFPFFLIACSPIIALDMSIDVGVPAQRSAFAIVGLVAACSFAVAWLGRRGLAGVSADSAFLASFMLCAAAVAYASSRVIDGPVRGRAGWFVIACVIVVLALSTGTRSAFLLATLPAVALVVSGRHTFVRRIGYAVAGLLMGGLTIAVMAIAFTAVLGVDRGMLQDRLTSLPLISDNGVTYQSLNERAAQREAASATWASSPIIGAGAGTRIEWIDSSGMPRSSFTSDTVIAFPAKFGAIGVLALVIWLLAIAGLLRHFRSKGAHVAGNALVALAVVSLGYAFLSSPLEDKGAAFGLIFLIALLVSEPGQLLGTVSRPRQRAAVGR